MQSGRREVIAIFAQKGKKCARGSGPTSGVSDDLQQLLARRERAGRWRRKIGLQLDHAPHDLIVGRKHVRWVEKVRTPQDAAGDLAIEHRRR